MTIGQRNAHWISRVKKKTGGEEKTHVNCKIIKNQCEELGVNHQEP